MKCTSSRTRALALCFFPLDILLTSERVHSFVYPLGFERTYNVELYREDIVPLKFSLRVRACIFPYEMSFCAVMVKTPFYKLLSKDLECYLHIILHSRRFPTGGLKKYKIQGVSKTRFRENTFLFMQLKMILYCHLRNKYLVLSNS